MDEWDSLLNPYEESIEKGSKEGLEAGLQAGFDDGYHLGRVKALEIGFELGYMHSVASSALAALLNLNNTNNNANSSNSSNSSNNDRRVTRLKEFIDWIQAFPSPDELFSTKNHYLDMDAGTRMNIPNANANANANANTNEHEHDDDDDDDEEENPTRNGSSKIDVAHKMQRIRAKFKTIVVQIKMPHLTLQKIMNGGTLGVGIGVGASVGSVGVNAAATASLSLPSNSASQGGVVKNHMINSRVANVAVVHDNEW